MPTVRRAFLLVLAVVAALSTALAGAGPLPKAAPEEVGLSSARLARLTAVMQEWVERKEAPGAVVMIARHGKLAFVHAAGYRDAARGAPLAEDAIFRAYSMTKPIVSVAAMMLVEDGLIALHDPVSKFIPEFGEMRVAIEGVDPGTGAATFDTAPAKRQMTVHDLLRHTSGLTYGDPLPVRTQLQRMYREAGIWSQDWVLADFARALARLPLAHEPGTTWEYGHSTDILGRVIEVASGQTLDVFLAERIFRPLGMKDTAFSVPSDKAGRLAQPRPDPVTGQVPDLIDFTRPQGFFAGGHGLVTTAHDYMRFAEMLLEGGTLEGTRILGSRTLAHMAADHVHPGIARGNFLPGPGYGFGLGFAVRTERGMSVLNGSVDEIYWGGYAGTYFWVDPQEQLVVVFMTTDPNRRAQYRTPLRHIVYGAIVE
jgi:CubicO group peptidase (beta-lactamase class C family)